MAARVVVVGSFNADLVAYTKTLPRPGETVRGEHFRTVPGGKGSNQAVAAARLGADVTFVAPRTLLPPVVDVPVVQDLDEIIEQHLMQGKLVERLQIVQD